jgi:hypothetical protein
MEAAASHQFSVAPVEIDSLLDFSDCIVHEPFGLDAMTAFVGFSLVQFTLSGA